jgi:hypothetical protein
MQRIITTLALSVALVASTAWAQDDYGSSDQSGSDQGGQAAEPGSDQAGQAGSDQSGSDQSGVSGDQAGQPAGTTVATGEEVTKGMLKNEKFGVRPQLGTILYNDQNTNSAARFAAGLTIDMNALAAAEGQSPWYLGPESGIIYSHLGAAGSNFFGTNSSNTSSSSAGANFFYIPANLKVGYNLSDKYRVAAHGGGNITYRSSGVSMDLGPSTAVANSTWRVYPNIGLDLEASMAKNVALTLRPDYTFTPGSNFFTGTLAIAVGLG